MKKPISHRVRALTFSCAVLFAACADEHVKKHDDSADEAKAGEGGADEEDGDGGRAGDGGGDAAKPRTGDGGAGLDVATAQTDGGAGAVTPGNGGGATSQSDGGSSSGAQAEGGAAAQNECAAKAKEECEYQKKCDPVHFARDWDGDINQFCIPKRTKACEKNEPMTTALAISAACNTWVHASCDNHRNFYFPVTDSNGKWQYGDPVCEVGSTVRRGDKSDGNDCRSDYECKAGLFCKVADDDYLKHGDPSAEKICGKCAPQLAYDGPNSGDSYLNETNCYDQEQCKVGYSCLAVYGIRAGEFQTLSFNTRTTPNTDFTFCVKNIVKAGLDKDCAKDSNAQCDTGLVCEPTMAGGTVGKCKAASGATIDTYVGKDARCMPAICDKRQHLDCKPVQVGGTTENRCVPQAIAPIGGYCKNDKKEGVADCSRYARCTDASGQCTRRNLETESCFPTMVTPSSYDIGSCDPAVFGYESVLVCRQDDGELSPRCHKGVFQAMCSLQ